MNVLDVGHASAVTARAASAPSYAEEDLETDEEEDAEDEEELQPVDGRHGLDDALAEGPRPRLFRLGASRVGVGEIVQQLS